jgi:hypothetical protein
MNFREQPRASSGMIGVTAFIRSLSLTHSSSHGSSDGETLAQELRSWEAC